MFQFGPQGRNINMLILWALCNGHNINGPCLHNINGQILFKFQIEPRGHNINMLILWPPWTCLLLWPHGHVWYCGLLVKIDIMASWLLILWCPPLKHSCTSQLLLSLIFYELKTTRIKFGLLHSGPTDAIYAHLRHATSSRKFSVKTSTILFSAQFYFSSTHLVDNGTTNWCFTGSDFFQFNKVRFYVILGHFWILDTHQIQPTVRSIFFASLDIFAWIQIHKPIFSFFWSSIRFLSCF